MDDLREPELELLEPPAWQEKALVGGATDDGLDAFSYFAADNIPSPGEEE